MSVTVRCLMNLLITDVAKVLDGVWLTSTLCPYAWSAN